MEHSTQPRASHLDLAVVVVVDLAARLAVPVALLTLAHGAERAAALSAAAVAGLAVLRGVASGRVLERYVREAWGALIEATCARDVVGLRTRPSEEHLHLLVDGSYRTIEAQASVVPRIIADSIGVVVVVLAVAWRLGWHWLLLGALAMAVVVLLMVPVRRAFHAAESVEHGLFAEIVRDFEALLDAPSELRAHRREASLALAARRRIAAMAVQQRRVNTMSALMGLLPAGLAILAIAAPMWRGLVAPLVGTTFAEMGVLGASALVFALGLMRSVEALARSAPQRALFARFLQEGREGTGQASVAESTREWSGDIEIVGVSVVYPGAREATPHRMSLTWREGTSLALGGDNGAGKSTLVLVILGLVTPSEGKVLLDGAPLETPDYLALRKRVVYLPQQPFVSDSRSVAWHLRLLSGDSVDDESLERALRSVGLMAVLERHAEASECGPLDVAVGELSGGERQRMHLARMLLPHHGERPQLIILDEPEVGLDTAGRAVLRGLLGELASSARVLLIAHDSGVVPDDFVKHRCARETV